MGRISMMDSLTDALTKLCDGNPGAINACCLILKESRINRIMILDTLGIYGTDIYVLWNDICQRDVSKVIAILTMASNNTEAATLLKDACSRQDYSGCRLLRNNEMFKEFFGQ